MVSLTTVKFIVLVAIVSGGQTVDRDFSKQNATIAMSFNISGSNNNESHRIVKREEAEGVLSGHEKEFIHFQALHSLIPFFGLAILWFILLITFIVAKCVAMAYEERKVGHLYDGCTSSTVDYKFIVKFTFGKYSKNFPIQKAYVMMDILDHNKQFITRIAIPPQWMSPRWTRTVKLGPRLTARAAKFELNRSKAMNDIGYIRIGHDVNQPINQSLVCYNVEIKDLIANLVTKVIIQRAITTISPDSSADYQVFEALPPTIAKNDGDLYVEGISPRITIVEYGVFLMLYANLCLLVTLLVPNFLQFYTVGGVIANGILASLISLILAAIPAIIYKYGVKVQYANNIGTGFWNLIRTAYLFSIIVIALSVGITGAILASGLEAHAIKHWLMTLIIATAMLIVAALVVKLIFYIWERYLYWKVNELKSDAVEECASKVSSADKSNSLRKLSPGKGGTNQQGSSSPPQRKSPPNENQPFRGTSSQTDLKSRPQIPGEAGASKGTAIQAWSKPKSGSFKPQTSDTSKKDVNQSNGSPKRSTSSDGSNQVTILSKDTYTRNTKSGQQIKVGSRIAPISVVKSPESTRIRLSDSPPKRRQTT